MAEVDLVDLVTAVLLVIIAILGLVLNILVILTVLQHKGLQNPFTAIICFICVVHIVEYVVPLPLKITGDLLYGDVPNWTFGSTMCKIFHYSFCFLTYGVIYCIALLILDRYFDVMKAALWNEKAALMTCGGIALTFAVLNAGVPIVYDVQKEFVGKGKDMETCSLVALQGLTLACFFVFSYFLPIVITFGGVLLLTRMLRVRKELRLGQVTSDFMAKITIIIFSFGSYAILRLLWHVDRLLLAGGLVFDHGDLVIQDIAEILWYLNGVFIPIFVIALYPDFRNSVKSLCCGSDIDYLTYTSEEDLVLMPVVTTVADPERFDNWPQKGYAKSYHGSEASLASTTINSKPESPTSPKWRVVRTLEKPPLKSYVERVPAHQYPGSTKLERKNKGRGGYSSNRSRSSSPASEHREDTIKSRRPKLFKKKKLKKNASSGDEGN